MSDSAANQDGKVRILDIGILVVPDYFHESVYSY
jgi:hypothetical protein